MVALNVPTGISGIQIHKLAVRVLYSAFNVPPALIALRVNPDISSTLQPDYAAAATRIVWSAVVPWTALSAGQGCSMITPRFHPAAKCASPIVETVTMTLPAMFASPDSTC